MGSIFVKLVNMSIIASLLIITVIILRIVLKKAPKWIFCLLWGIVAVRLMIPFSPKSALSLISNPEPFNPAVIQLSQGAENSGSFTADSANPVFSVWNLTFLSGAVWLTGFVILLCYAIISYYRMKKRLQEAVLLHENICICDHVSSPFILGIFRPRIYLPSGMGEEEAAYVIAHEQAHLKRRDHIWKPLGFLLLSVYWFNPLIWAAYSLFCKDIESACDEKVIKDLNFSERKKYSEALFLCSLQRKNITAYPLAFGEIGVKERIKNVLNYKKPAFWIGVTAVLICMIVAVCFLTVSKNDTSEDMANIQEDQKQYENHSDSNNAENGLPGLEELEPVVEGSWPTGISRTTQETTAKNLSFEIQIDEPMVITISCVTESGQIDMEIEDKNGNSFFDENDMQTGSFDVDLNEAGTYTVMIQADRHTGSFQIAPKR